MKTTIIGIDIGANGAVAFIRGEDVWSINFNNSTLQDIKEAIEEATVDGVCKAYVEQVASSPQMGVKSAFSFGQRYGEVLGILTALEIPFEMVRPQEWQKALKCLTKGDKNVTKTKAQQLYPQIKITHSNADALLIATYGKQVDK